MTFKKYVRRHAGQQAAYYAYFKDFPCEPDWRGLKLFVNKYAVPDVVAAELEDLHDAYHCRHDSLKFFINKILKGVL